MTGQGKQPVESLTVERVGGQAEVIDSTAILPRVGRRTVSLAASPVSFVPAEMSVLIQPGPHHTLRGGCSVSMAPFSHRMDTLDGLRDGYDADAIRPRSARRPGLIDGGTGRLATEPDGVASGSSLRQLASA